MRLASIRGTIGQSRQSTAEKSDARRVPEPVSTNRLGETMRRVGPYPVFVMLCVCVLAWWAAASAVLATEIPVAETDPGQAVAHQSTTEEQNTSGPVEIFGEYTPYDFSAWETDGLDGPDAVSVGPLANLPVVSEGLETMIAQARADQPIRVLVFLRHLPQDRISSQVNARYAGQRAAIEAEIDRVLAQASARRDPSMTADKENYGQLVRTLPQEREALRGFNEQMETIGLSVKTDLSAELSAELAPFFARVRSEIERLGGEFEFSAIAGSLVVGRVPAARIAELGRHPDVLRISEDRLEHEHLDIMDDATEVSSSGGLWDSGADGGAYDPAVIDTGLDRTHPAMAGSASPLRNNFWTWYLVAGAADPTFNDYAGEDDLQGHGTHVAGIVGSYGSTGYSAHLGMAYGVEKLVTLKAGWRNTFGDGKMYWSDRHNIVDRALYHNENLYPVSTFNDDVDGLNLSFGGSTTDDDTDDSRFWDSVISSYSDLPMTISAGNSGPSNANFNNPAITYNAITVANVWDHGTADRVDDTIASSSSVGPTASGRRKPDIAAPGSSIMAPRNTWEGTNADFISKSGTSMSSPSVLGVAMDLMDAGVWDELEIKALLINTAQKNEPGIDIESDSDGWDDQIGWGYMNAWAAHYHRNDVVTSSVTPRGTAGDYRLFKGVMRDEGAGGEGRDRVTMAWNRHATYNPAAPPSTYYSLANLNLRLYRETDNFFYDIDSTVSDNVHQVRIGSGAGSTDVVVKAYSWSTSFAHGGATENFALATEEGFTEVTIPSAFSGLAQKPSSVEPGETFDLEVWVRNNDEIASHNNTLDLNLPAGWTLVSGSEIQNLGSAAGGGGYSAHGAWTIQVAPAQPIGLDHVITPQTHDSYGTPWGTINWGTSVNVQWDTTAPTPNPMTFSTPPHATGQSSVEMWATTASDLHEPIDYYLYFGSSPTGGSGGTNSGWQPGRQYIDGGLGTNHEYCYRPYARDSAVAQNQTSMPSTSCAYTLIQTALAPVMTPISTSAIDASPVGTFANLGSGSSGVMTQNLTHGTSSGWVQSTAAWGSTGLSTNTEYVFRTRSRNGDAVESTYGPVDSAYTLIETALAPSMTPVSTTAINVSPAGTFTNLAGASSGVMTQNLTLGTSTGWVQTTAAWGSAGLSANSEYVFRTRSRNGDGVESTYGPTASSYTLIEAPPAPSMSPTSTSSIGVQLPGSYSNLGAGSSGLRIDNLTNGANSGWIQGPVNWASAGLGANTEYSFAGRSRNGDGVENPLGPTASAYSLIEAPAAPMATATSATTIDALSQGSYSNIAAGVSGLRVDNLTQGTQSGWVQGPVSWTSSGLTPNTEYTFAGRSRNGGGVENPPGPTTSARTHAAEPAPTGFATRTHASLTARWLANGNPAGTEYWVENLTTGADSGWTTNTEWVDTSTGPEMTYTYQGKARNADLVETAIVHLGDVESPFWGDGFESGDTAAWSDTAP